MEDGGLRNALFQRWPLLLCVAVVAVWTSPALDWGLLVAATYLCGSLAFHTFRPDVLGRWVERRWLLASDAALATLALAGTGHFEPTFFVGFFGVVLWNVTLVGRMRAWLASAATVAAMAAIHATAAGPNELWVVQHAAEWPLLVATAWHFGSVAAWSPTDRPQTAAIPGERAAELRALLDITKAISSSLDVGRVMRSIVRSIGNRVDSDCSVLLADPSVGTGFVLASRDSPDVDMLEFDLSKYPEVKRALETREPVLIEDVERDPLLDGVRDAVRQSGYRSLFVVPLLFGDEVLGTLFLRARREQSFQPDEMSFCTIAAGACANALKNALLFRQVHEESERHRATGEKLRRVLDGTPDVIVAIDEDGRITEFNRGAEEFSGQALDRVLGRRLNEVFGSDAPNFGDALESPGEPVEVRMRRAGGDRVELSLVGAYLGGVGDETTGQMWLGRDVTQLRRVEKSLAQAERLSSLGEVVAGVAHELNNPLSAVMGYAELLRPGAAPNQTRDLDRIIDSSVRCQKIVQKLLSFARKHVPEKRPGNLNECVSKVLDLKSYHLRSSQLETVTELADELPETLFDFHQVEQVILNLLNNAEQAITSTRAPGRIVFRTGKRDDEIYLQVEDNGPGVPAAVRERVFDPFVTTKELGQGTGLGLSVSYGIIQEHGGRIELAEPGEDAGACFTVFLPVVACDLEPRVDPTARDADPAPLSGKRILIAEDEPLVLDMLARVLEASGAKVAQAIDGEEAWRHLESAEFDLVLVDLRMPGLSGKQLYERAAEERPGLLRRFVFATGDLARPETQQFLQGVPNRILPKPLDVDTVRRVLAQALASTTNV